MYILMPRKAKPSEARVPPKGGAARGGSTLVEGPHPELCNYYIVTIKCNNLLPVSREMLDQVYEKLVKRVKRAEWTDVKAYEEDSFGRMHIHTYCLIRGKTPYFKSLQIPGWTIDFTWFEWYDRNLVLNYLMKRDQSDNAVNQMFEANQYRFGYRFVDGTN